MTTIERLAVESSENTGIYLPNSLVEENQPVSQDTIIESTLSPEDLISRDRARANNDILEVFVAVGRISLEDKIALQTTGSRASKAVSRVQDMPAHLRN